MCRKVENDIFLDDFPVSWLEGTACMMEELGFPDVNDYTQYSADFFDAPSQFTVFSTTTDGTIYSNVLVCLYVYRNICSSDDPIGFVRSIIMENMAEPESFEKLLSNASGEYGLSWSQVLNSFHTASFYSGERAVDGQFLDDASILPEWDYTKGEANRDGDIAANVLPWSVRYISYLKDDAGDSALSINFTFQGNADAKECAVSVILHDTNGFTADTIVTYLSSDNKDFVINIPHWLHYEEAIVALTNGMQSDNVSLSVKFATTVSEVIDFKPVVRNTVNRNENHPALFLLNGKRFAASMPVKSGRRQFSSFQQPGTGFYIKKNGASVNSFINIR
jgi:hypothetical protein